MPYCLDPGDTWTEAKVARALIAAWRENPRTPEAADFLNQIPELLLAHPKERYALHLRSFSFARRSDARLSDILVANRISRATFERRWRRGVRFLVDLLNRDLAREQGVHLPPRTGSGAASGSQ